MSNTIDLGVEHLADPELIGRGGFSVVYAATDTRFDRRVAVKVLTKLFDEAGLRRFERECRAMGRLSSHPNVVTVHEAGATADGLPFLVMELVDGGSLERRVEQGPVPWPEAVDLTIPIAEALAHTHAAGVLHRDVKPENVLVDLGVPKLTDFGISSFLNSTGAASSTIAASWQHAPPETFANTRNAVSDVYSLGSTLYTLLAGQPPLWRDGEDTVEPLMYRILHTPPPGLPVGSVPPALDRLVQRTLAKDPGQRPPSAIEFAADLVRVRAGEPIEGDGPTGPTGPSGSASSPVPAGGATSLVRPPVDEPPTIGSGGPDRAGPDGVRLDGRSGRSRSPRSLAPVVVGGLAVVVVAVAGLALGFRPGADSTSSEGTGVASPGSGAAADGASDNDGTVESVTAPAPTSTSSTVAPSTSTTGTTTASSPPSSSPSTAAPDTATPESDPIPGYEGSLASGTGGVDELTDFVLANQGAIIRLDVTIDQPVEDYFAPTAGDDGVGVQLYSGCADKAAEQGLSIETCEVAFFYNFLAESAGTSFVGRGRNGTTVSGYFAVGIETFFSQGILAIPLDPITLEAALAAT
ncbi:MAG: protein kinase, partial [Actinomycetota bacterium]